MLGRSGFMAAGRPYHSPNPHEVKAVTSASNIFGSQDTIGTLREGSGVFPLKIKISKYFCFPLISIFDKLFVSREIVVFYHGPPYLKPFFSLLPVRGLVYREKLGKYGTTYPCFPL